MSNNAAGLFAGIGGLEVGLSKSGWQTTLLCENNPAAQAVLRRRMPDIELHGDVRKLRSLPRDVGLVAAGFPCQDLSQAGRTRGITGENSGLVGEVFRLIKRKNGPGWLLLENVPFMLQLDRGAAMRHLTNTLDELGYRWAYRVVDARAFGLPQRRHRVLMLASRTEDPRPILFGQDAGAPDEPDAVDYPCGFYWTEGVRGLGWAVDAVPTIKGGSTIGIASPPAVWLKSGEIVTPGIVDAERLQGFEPDWTEPALEIAGIRQGQRWKLVGNAVSTRMSEWIGSRLGAPADQSWAESTRLRGGEKWPRAAWGDASGTYEVNVSMWPVRDAYEHLEGFLEGARPLSVRATAGFLRRCGSGSLRFVPGFLEDVEAHLARISVGMEVA
ncbi:DNA (cytosine-5-)-methyltransferase [Mycobacterium angelicum]|uniref:DNA (cytosine-5-)-methyltransferase n=1 Tax=Mycobacterium angelicum TaxID=470074 RepID=A0A1W9ZUA9_MYCAN|nr:DNA (cytosine-5-)-methyltransferase [Mycobacterium angelicum]MCV7199967.1 DNA (cytosine-5-)-methyltransferase [Mycobacterium angelicum]ORA21380.1 DNA (cytosine-5-)-methyltransferase [Mycobacterium angelicum]